MKNSHSKLEETYLQSEKRPSARHIRLPGFVREEVGLGDLIKRATYAIGIPACGSCSKRAEALNRHVIFTR